MFAVLVWNAPCKEAGFLRGPFGSLEEATRRAGQLLDEDVFDRAEVMALGEVVLEMERNDAECNGA